MIEITNLAPLLVFGGFVLFVFGVTVGIILKSIYDGT